ncbi:MAG: hypothetical protein VZR56_00720, partial [Treponema sp.]|nr:hypothetical protein [Treponema sp.]
MKVESGKLRIILNVAKNFGGRTKSLFTRISLGRKSSSLLEPAFRHYALAPARLKSVCLAAWLRLACNR